jgi:hypothetical protein
MVSVASSLVNPTDPSPQISLLSNMYVLFSIYKPENAISVYCDFVCCTPGIVPVYYSCCICYIKSILLYHPWHIFFHVLHLYSSPLFNNSKNNKCETCNIVLFQCILLDIKLIFPDLDWKMPSEIPVPILNGLISLTRTLKDWYAFVVSDKTATCMEQSLSW